MFYKKIILAVALGASMSSASAADYYPAVPVADLEAFFGMPSGEISSINPGDGIYIDPPIEGSGLVDTFNFVAGDLISFDYNFMTDEVGPNLVNDYAFVSIGGQIALLDHVLGSPSHVSDYYYRETGYLSFSYSAPFGGELDFGVGIVDVGDGVTDSALLIDNIQVKRNSVEVFRNGFELTDPLSYAIGDAEMILGDTGLWPTEGDYQAIITTAPSVAHVPLPPAVWLLFSGVAALMSFGRVRQAVVE